tara:strand:+ start:106 stop:990 length:885 start_codon:yes stop_codon:yes gene_type:complete
MPVVDIKGVGKAQFPDEMPVNDIKTFLRNKYFQDVAQGNSRALDPQPQTAANVNPSLIETAGQKVSDYLFDQGIISDRYRAQEVGKSIAGLGEFLPVIGDATAGDDFGKAAAQGDKLGMGIGLLGAVPVLGDAAKKGVKWYHGTNANIDDLINTGFNTTDRSLDPTIPNALGDNIGMFFAQNKNHSKQFGKNIMETDLDIKNPKIFKTQEDFRAYMRTNSGVTPDVRDSEGFIIKEGVFQNNTRKAIEAGGFDGVVIERPNYTRSKSSDKPWAIAFDPKQIKPSTNNTNNSVDD